MAEQAGEFETTLLAITRAIAEEDPVCAACLGRVVADRSYGLTNEARGTALRTVLSLAEDVPYEPPDPMECWVCEGHSSRVDIWASRVVSALDEIAFDTYQIGCRVPPLLEENDRLLREVGGVAVTAGEPLKRELNREVGKVVGRETGSTVDFERPDVLALLHLEREEVEVSINPAFVYGRYRKYERDIPQTEWPCTECGGSGKRLGTSGERPCEGCDGTGYRYERSVEGLTAPIVAAEMDGTAGIFHGAGREDVDARMLGTGRPFVIEVKEPRSRRPDLEAVRERINDEADGAVEVDELSFATHEMVERVKALSASKTYRLEIDLDESVGEADFDAAIVRLDGATVEQRTPTRVRHRRADRVRTRKVYACSGELTGAGRATIEVHGEGGLYVKELVHGDGGRTRPSLAGELGVEVTVNALDVLAVEGEGEPFDDPAYLLPSGERHEE